MATSCKVGTFTTTTGTSNIPVTGVGFTPKAILFWSAGLTAAATGQAHANFGFGWCTGTGNRGCVLLNDEDAVGTTDSNSQHRNDAVLGLRLTDSTGNDGLLDLVSFDADGFTVVPDDAFAGDYLVHYLALGGDSITNAVASNTSAPTSAGTFDVTGLGFQPTKLLLLHGHRAQTAINNTANTGFGIGVYDGSASRCMAYFSLDGTTAEQCGAIIRNDGVMNATTDGSVTDLYTFDSFLADGFRLNKVDGTSGHTFGYLAFSGIDLKISDLENQAATGNFSATSVGFKPSGVLFAGLRGASTYLTSNLGDVQSCCIGAATSTSDRGAVTVSMDDAADPTVTARSQSTTRCYLQHNTAEPHAVAHEWDFVSFDSDGYTLNQVATNGATHKVIGIAFGPAATAAAEPASTEDILRVEV